MFWMEFIQFWTNAIYYFILVYFGFNFHVEMWYILRMLYTFIVDTILLITVVHLYTLL